MPKVIVAGSLNMDIVARTSRHPSPGETIMGESLHFFPGGKGGNQAVAAAKLGAHTVMIGKLGDDAFANDVTNFLKDQKLDLTAVMKADGMATGTTLIVVDADSQNTIVVIPGANFALRPSDIETIEIRKGDVLLSQFEISLETIESFFLKGRILGAMTILNAAPAIKCSKLLNLADVIVVNEVELAFLLDIDLFQKADINTVVQMAGRLRSDTGQRIIVTLGERGAVALVEERQIYVPGRTVKAIDTTGAGDCFVGALSAAIAVDSSFEDALKYANIAASICIQRMGAAPSMPTVDDVKAILRCDS